MAKSEPKIECHLFLGNYELSPRRSIQRYLSIHYTISFLFYLIVLPVIGRMCVVCNMAAGVYQLAVALLGHAYGTYGTRSLYNVRVHIGLCAAVRHFGRDRI